MKSLTCIIILALTFSLLLGAAFASMPQYSETTVLVTVVPVFELTFETSGKGVDVVARSSYGNQWFLKAEGSELSWDYTSKKKEWNNMPEGTAKVFGLDQNKYILISLTE